MFSLFYKVTYKKSLSIQKDIKLKNLLISQIAIFSIQFVYNYYTISFKFFQKLYMTCLAFKVGCSL